MEFGTKLVHAYNYYNNSYKLINCYTAAEYAELFSLLVFHILCFFTIKFLSPKKL